MVAAIWVVDALFQSIPLFGVNNFDSSPMCLYEQVMDKWYRICNFTSGLFLAFGMLLVYIKIYFVVKKHVTQIVTDVPQIDAIRVQQKRHVQMNRVIPIVVIFFHISWLPFFFIQMTMLEPAGVTHHKVLVANFLVFLGIMNSVVNPVVYAWRNTQYRRAFKKLLGRPGEIEEVTVIAIA